MFYHLLTIICTEGFVKLRVSDVFTLSSFDHGTRNYAISLFAPPLVMFCPYHAIYDTLQLMSFSAPSLLSSTALPCPHATGYNHLGSQSSNLASLSLLYSPCILWCLLSFHPSTVVVLPSFLMRGFRPVGQNFLIAKTHLLSVSRSIFLLLFLF